MRSCHDPRHPADRIRASQGERPPRRRGARGRRGRRAGGLGAGGLVARGGPDPALHRHLPGRLLQRRGGCADRQRRVRRHPVLRGHAVPRRAHRPQDDGRMDRASTRRPKPRPDPQQQLLRRGRRQLPRPLHRADGRPGRHHRMRRRHNLLPRRNRHPRPDGRVPHPSLRPRPRPRPRLQRRGPRRLVLRPGQRARRVRNHRRLRRRHLLPQPANHPRTNGHLPRKSPRPRRTAHSHTDAAASSRPDLPSRHRRRLPLLRPTNRQHHHLLGQRRRPRRTRRPIHSHHRRQQIHVRPANRQHHHLLGLQRLRAG